MSRELVMYEKHIAHGTILDNRKKRIAWTTQKSLLDGRVVDDLGWFHAN